MQNCVSCKHARVFLWRDEDDRNTIKPAGYVHCGKPKYKSRKYFVSDNKPACSDYTPRRPSATTENV